MTIGRLSWAAAHALLLALVVFTLDTLLLKPGYRMSDPLPACLLLILGIVLLIRGSALRASPRSRSALQRAWASIDSMGSAWLVFLLLLLLVFHYAFQRAGGDGREYFSQLRSVFIDHDLDFANEMRDFGSHDVAIFPFGSAILWMPFYLLAHLWLRVRNVFGGDFRMDGYFYPYQMAIGLGTMAYGFAGLVFIYKIASDYFTRALALTATLVVCAGSFLFWYLAVDNSYTHGNSLFAVTLFLFLWYRTRKERTLASWGWLGLSGGLMVMVRWQNAAFLAPLALDVLRGVWQAVRCADFSIGSRTLQGAVLAGGCFVLGFLPQMYFWKVVNGGWLAVPHGQAGQQWWRDSLMLDVLFSPNHGLFAWHPVLYLALLGMPLFVKRDRYVGVVLVGLFAAQVYTNGAVATWWGGTAFGGRRFDGCVLLFVLGLASLIEWCQKRPTIVWSGLLGTLVLANGFLMEDVWTGALPMGEGISVEKLIGATTRRVGNPFSFPANAIFAWRNRTSLSTYDRLGQQLVNSVAIDLGAAGDTPFLMDGWAEPEDDRGVSFRWGVGDQSSFAVPLMGPRFVQPGQRQRLADFVLRVRVSPFGFDGAPRQSLTLEVNGTALDHYELDPGFREYEFAVPHSFLNRNLNTLTFRYRFARSPQELGMSDDPRRLAVRFDYIRFLPTGQR